MTTQTDSLDECIKKFVPSKQHKKILAELNLWVVGRTRAQLSSATEISVPSMCARLNELVKGKYVDTIYTVLDSTTNRRVKCYKLVQS